MAVLTPSPDVFAPADSEVHVLPLPESSEELAHALYAVLRRVDDLKCDVALVTPPRQGGLGTAIADRISRAAGPRGDDSP